MGTTVDALDELNGELGSLAIMVILSMQDNHSPSKASGKITRLRLCFSFLHLQIPLQQALYMGALVLLDLSHLSLKVKEWQAGPLAQLMHLRKPCSLIPEPCGK